jgi:hypothetical protein
MDQFLPPILEWISTTHGSGRHEQYGWVIISLFAISIAKRLSQSEKSENKKSLHAQQAELLKKGPLFAIMYSEESQATIKYTAELKAENEGYRMTIRALQQTQEKKIFDYFANTLEVIDKSIRAETQFTISDFKLSNGS